MLFSEKLKSLNFNIHELTNAKIMITGATGLIGKTAAVCLAELSEQFHLNIQLFLVVRDERKLDIRLKNYLGNSVFLIQCDVVDFCNVDIEVDYVIHGASITSSQLMISNPVEVILTNIIGSKNILEYSKKIKAKSVVYLSSMEAYGFCEEEIPLTEDNIQYLNPTAVRSCYPESKRMVENMCVCYANEYDVNVKIARLAQTFGKGVDKNDTRVFAEFARCAVNKKDIVLLTNGKSKRMYLDVEDAVIGILFVMLKGQNGSAYNIANRKTYCSISEMAQLVTETIGNGEIAVKYNIDDSKAKCFSPPHKLYLDTTKIENLGWRACTSLEDSYRQMIEDWA